MRYFTTRAFDSGVHALPELRKRRVKKSLAKTVAFFETGDLPQGLGMKPLGRSLWEIRAGLRDRIIFLKKQETIEFLLVGSHDEVRKFLKEQ